LNISSRDAQRDPCCTVTAGVPVLGDLITAEQWQTEGRRMHLQVNEGLSVRAGVGSLSTALRAESLNLRRLAAGGQLWRLAS